MPLIAADAFSNASADSWSDADKGGAWTRNGTNANWDKAGGVGTVVVPAGNVYVARLASVANTADVFGQAKFTYSGADPTELECYTTLRVGGDSLMYCGGVVFADDGEIHARINDKFGPTGGEEAVLTDVDLGIAYNPGDVWWALFEATGTTLRLKIWPDGGPVPGSWTATTSDSTHTTGHVGMRFVNQTGASVTAIIDDYNSYTGAGADVSTVLLGGL